ncbi:Bidirectional sugar transporter SWEET14 [Apostasia shenzhenica]|uniref:Bidirectional sugar transporter SWEET14 n=1 Tax=Apostasia shenzhenica TaxID=1088818 RepID=A0A2H9ZXI1_9ASPA|nr:Bidirectional sugar transporter SWEET14 [Apostasia shenzhenica]
MLWLYFAFIKTDEMILLIINSIGVIIESFHIAIYMAYAHNKARKPMEGKVKNACQHIKPVIEEDEEEQGKASQGKNKAEKNMKNDIISQA